jgi:hypothetical protein
MPPMQPVWGEANRYETRVAYQMIELAKEFAKKAPRELGGSEAGQKRRA